MTRINGTYSPKYIALQPSRTARPSAGSTQRILVTRSDLVNDEPIEEVIFEPNSGLDQRNQNRNAMVSEPKEDVLIDRRNNAVARDQFWQRFSTPFMAQVIGQDKPTARTQARAYGASAALAQQPPWARQSKAC